MEGIKRKFAQCKEEKRPALVTYVTAGYPSPEETVNVLLGMEAGGAGEWYSEQLFESNLLTAYRFN